MRDASPDTRSVRLPRAEARDRPPAATNNLQPWQFFVLAALACATAVTFLSRGQGVTTVVLLGVLMGATALVGLAALRAVRPLVSPPDDRTAMIGERTRAALEREKTLALRSIKELEFDRAMGKLSDSDWLEMSTRLRTRAARLMRQLDAGAGYREQIERELEKRLRQADARLKPSRYEERDEDPRRAKASAERHHPASDDAGHSAKASAERDHGASDDAGRGAKASAERLHAAARICDSCSTENDADARFCKTCGNKL